MRLRELKNHLKKKGISCVLLFNLGENTNPNFAYFTNYGGYGCFIIPKKGRPILLVPKMEEEKARKTKNNVIVYKKNFWKRIKKYCRGKRIGIDYGDITLAVFKSLRRNLKKRRFTNISRICSEFRAVKTKKELAYLRKACKITDKIIRKCFRNFKKFKTEKNVVDFLDEETRKNNCEFSFPPIVASGSSSSQPHYVPKNTKLRKGFCVIDFGVKYKSYCSDMTRTVYIGKPKEKEKEMYNLLLKAQKETIKELRPGQKCSGVYKTAVKKLGKYSKNFIHGLGHGVGLEIHELPNLKPKSNETVEESMVLTIEPGIYFKGKFGIRIEDTVLMRKRPVILTKTPKSLLRAKKR